MMDGLVTVVGHIGQDPVRKTTSKGEVLEFSVARNERVLQPDGTWAQGATTWFTVNAWDDLAVNAGASLRKGQRVLVQGVLQSRPWTGQDGQERQSVTLRARAIGHDLSQGVTTFSRSAPAAARPPQEAVAAAAPQPAAGDWGAAVPEPLEPAVAGWSSSTGTTSAAAEDTPF